MPACEAGVDLVPGFDLIFALLPAEIDFTALMEGGEVDQAFLKVLEFHADVVQFIDEIAKLIHRLLVAGFERFNIIFGAWHFDALAQLNDAVTEFLAGIDPR